jgi:pimeloyl-ACP methyl ester carboxylesterase
MAPLLRRAGHDVWTPTLTGLGEREHLANPDVGLHTHLQDVIGVLRWEDLREVILVGHSYGGMVITGVAARAAERLSRLVYLDAFVPLGGQSLADLLGPQTTERFRSIAERDGQGWRLPLPFPPESLGVSDPVLIESIQSRVVMQPLKAMLEPVPEPVAGTAALPRSYLYCARAPMGLFESSAKYAREQGWDYRELDAGHGAPVADPGLVAGALMDVAEQRTAASQR